MSSYNAFGLLIFLTIWFYQRSALAKFTFTKLDCTTFDETFLTFKICSLKVSPRQDLTINIHVNLRQLPVSNININVALLKKDRVYGYRPFFYNSTNDFCAFMLNQSKFPYLNRFFGRLVKNSNLNHSCPYNHDIIVKDHTITPLALKVIPVMTGDYLFNIKFGVSKEWKAELILNWKKTD